MHTKTVMVCLLILIVNIGLVSGSCKRKIKKYSREASYFPPCLLTSLHVVPCVGDCTAGQGVRNCRRRFGRQAEWALVQNKTMNDYIVNELERGHGVTRLVVSGLNNGQEFWDDGGQSITYSKFNGPFDMEPSLHSLLVAPCNDKDCKVGDGANNCRKHFGEHAELAVVEDDEMNDFIAYELEKGTGVTRLVVNGVNSAVNSAVNGVNNAENLDRVKSGRARGFQDATTDDWKFIPYHNFTAESICIEIEMSKPNERGEWKAIKCSEQSQNIGHVCQVYYQTNTTVVVGNHVFEVVPCEGPDCSKKDASSVCSGAKGKLAVIHNSEICGHLHRLARTILVVGGMAKYLMIDATYNQSAGDWISGDGKVLPYTNFKNESEDTRIENELENKLLGGSMCAAISLDDKAEWVKRSCNYRYVNAVAVCDRLIDECYNNEPGCAHKCTDTDKDKQSTGKGLCSCNEGFKLMDDGKGCTKIG